MTQHSTPACPEHGELCVGPDCCCRDKHPRPEMKNFAQAEPGDQAQTFQFENGDLVYGEYGWVTDFDFFEEHPEGVVIRKTWVLVSVERRDLENEPCEDCDTEGTFEEDGAQYECANCKGEGYLANDWKKV